MTNNGILSDICYVLCIPVLVDAATQTDQEIKSILLDAATQTDQEIKSNTSCDAQTETQPGDITNVNNGSESGSEESELNLVPKWCEELALASDEESELEGEWSFEYGLDPDYTGPPSASQPCEKRGIFYTPPGWKRYYHKRKSTVPTSESAAKKLKME